LLIKISSDLSKSFSRSDDPIQTIAFMTNNSKQSHSTGKSKIMRRAQEWSISWKRWWWTRFFLRETDF